MKKQENNIENTVEEFMTMFHHKIKKEFRIEAIKFNFTISQIEVLHYVIKNKNPIMRDIADYLKITPPSVTTIIEFLTKKKLLKREIDKKDKRIVRIIATQKAIKTFEYFKNKRIRMIKEILSKLSVKDKNELVRILSLLKN